MCRRVQAEMSEARRLLEHTTFHPVSSGNSDDEGDDEAKAKVLCNAAAGWECKQGDLPSENCAR